MKPFRKTAYTAFAFAAILFCRDTHGGIITFGSGGNTFEMTFVEIGSPNNADDTTGAPNPAGKVEYTYQMGKYEVSEDMITKFNVSQSLEITKDTRGTNKPATSVSWNEAARFVNWLNTSQGFQAAYNFTTGGVNDNISLWNSADAWQLGGENLYRHKDAHYWLPSMDEWYKAAYYNPNTGVYGDYPSLTGSVPGAVSSGTADNTAVFNQTRARGPADITQAGGLTPFGIMGLGGNVLEWEETSLGLNNSTGSSSRGVRGGVWFYGSGNLSSSSRLRGSPSGESFIIGFRVASLSSSAAAVPEPSSAIAMSLLFGLGIAGRRLRRRNAAATL